MIIQLKLFLINMVSASPLFKGNGGGVCYFAFFKGKFYIKGTDDNLMIIRDD